MEISEIVDLFKKNNEKHNWGDESYILIHDDGSGEVISEDMVYMDSEMVFEFNTLTELINKLQKKLRE